MCYVDAGVLIDFFHCYLWSTAIRAWFVDSVTGFKRFVLWCRVHL